MALLVVASGLYHMPRQEEITGYANAPAHQDVQDDAGYYHDYHGFRKRRGSSLHGDRTSRSSHRVGTAG